MAFDFVEYGWRTIFRPFYILPKIRCSIDQYKYFVLLLRDILWTISVQDLYKKKLGIIAVPLFVCFSLWWCWSRSFCFWIAPWYWRCFFLGHFWVVVSGNLGKKEWQNLRGAKSGAARWTCPTMFAFASDTLSSFWIRIFFKLQTIPDTLCTRLA